MRPVQNQMNFRRAFSIFALGLLLVVISASLVFAQEPQAAHRSLHLRPSITVSGDMITFGDVFANAGDLAQVQLGHAPMPGQRMALDPAWLAARAVDHGAQWSNMSGLQRVLVSRSGDRMDNIQIAQMLSDELQHQTGNSYSVLVSATSGSIFLSTDGMQTAFVDSLHIDPASGLVTARIATGSGAPVTVRARAFVNRQVPVLTHAMARGDVIKDSDITWTSMRADRTGASAILKEDDLVGKEAKRNLRAGVLLRDHDVALPNAVTKGEMILIAYEVPGLKLTARGRVLENAPVGETVRAVNLQSNRTINVTIVAPGKGLAVVGEGVDG